MWLIKLLVSMTAKMTNSLIRFSLRDQSLSTEHCDMYARL